MIASDIDSAIKAVCPIVGISVGDPGDKSTWRINFADEATEQQRGAALQIVSAFDLQAAIDQATIADFELLVQTLLDTAAQARGYEGILSAVSYGASKHPRFGPDGIAYRDWRDAVWTYCYQALADVQAGKRAVPSAKDLIAELPPAPVFT